MVTIKERNGVTFIEPRFDNWSSRQIGQPALDFNNNFARAAVGV
jgi:hypothetical protein